MPFSSLSRTIFLDPAAERAEKRSEKTETNTFRHYWTLDQETIFLNHGSFGACPLPVLERQKALRERMESQPCRFMLRELPELLERARETLASFIKADRESLVFLPNATAGVNTVLASFPFRSGDRLLTTSHDYFACHNALTVNAERRGAVVDTVSIPFPLSSEEEIVEGILSAVTPKTRLALLDHVASPTGLVFPVQRLVAELQARGVECLVDGAHAPGMLPLEMEAFRPAFYTGNLHKWTCLPKGAAFLYVRHDLQEKIRPLSISHLREESGEGTPFQREFRWQGTRDYTPWLVIPEALSFLGSLLPGGWEELRESNHRKVVEGRRVVAEALNTPLPCPQELLGSLASLPLPPDGGSDSNGIDPLQERLYQRYHIEVPIMALPQPPRRLIRLSAQVYNSKEEYAALAEALGEELRRR